VETVQRVVPELLRRGAYGTVAKILRATNEQWQVPGAPTVFSELAGQLSQLAASKDTIEQLLADLHSSDKDRRTQVVEILAAAGEPAVAGLIKAYANGDNQSVRLSVFDAMKRIGPSALGSVSRAHHELALGGPGSVWPGPASRRPDRTARERHDAPSGLSSPGPLREPCSRPYSTSCSSSGRFRRVIRLTRRMPLARASARMAWRVLAGNASGGWTPASSRGRCLTKSAAR